MSKVILILMVVVANCFADNVLQRLDKIEEVLGMSKKKEVLINFVLDETGSMMSCKDTTISGFNEYIESMKKKKDKISMTLTRFNSEKIEIDYSDKPIDKVPNLTKENYNPNHLTPLYDAIGKTINETKDVKKNVLFVVLTDGEENSSKEYTRNSIFELIKKMEKKGWTFVYLGANQDAWANSGTIGFNQGNVINFNTKNMKATFRALNCSYDAYSTKVSSGVPVKGYFNNIDEDALTK